MILQIPDSDLFEVVSVSDIYERNVDNFLEEGCFISVIRRKEMMQFNSLFMIKVAETKGLFGDPSKQPQKKEVAPVTRQTSVNSRKSYKRTKVSF